MAYFVNVEYFPGGKEYRYLCDLPDVRVGDKVLVDAPFSGSNTEVTVTKRFGSTKPMDNDYNYKYIKGKVKVESKDTLYSIVYGNNAEEMVEETEGDVMNRNFGDRMMNRFFRKVDGVKWDLMSGNIGVQTDEGIVTIEGEGENAQLVINLLDEFGMPVPAFAQNTPLDSVTVGDLIYQGKAVKGWVTEVVEKEGSVARFKLMTTTGTATNWTPPKVSMFGLDSGVMVLRSLLNMLPKGEEGLGNMQGMLLPIMMMGGNDLNLDKMMPLMLLSQIGTDGSGGGAMGGNLVQTMMMMNMMGNGNSNFFD